MVDVASLVVDRWESGVFRTAAPQSVPVVRADKGPAGVLLAVAQVAHHTIG